VKTSIRLLLSALAVSCITLAAAGAPLPFLSTAGQQPALAISEPTLPFEASLAGLAPDGRVGQTHLQ
jgi:hypothetical protein